MKKKWWIVLIIVLLVWCGCWAYFFFKYNTPEEVVVRHSDYYEDNNGPMPIPSDEELNAQRIKDAPEWYERRCFTGDCDWRNQWDCGWCTYFKIDD